MTNQHARQYVPAAETVKPPEPDRLLGESEPMNAEELIEFADRLNSGWKCVRQTPQAVVQPQTTGEVGPGNHGAEAGSVGPLTQEIYQWLTETLDDNCHLTPRSHAWTALREFQSPPCSRDELLAFFRAFAVAYERLLYVRVEVARHTPSKSSGDATDLTSIGMAGGWPDRMAGRLKRLETLKQQSPADADLFCLTEFGGCSCGELSMYLRVPEDSLQQKLEDLRYDICVAEEAT